VPGLGSRASRALSACGQAALGAAAGVAHGIGRGRTALTRGVHRLVSVGSSLVSALARAAIGVTRAGVGVGGIAVAGITGRVLALGTSLIGYGRPVSALVARLAVGVGSTWTSAFQRAARATTAAGRAGVTRGLELLPRVLAGGRALPLSGPRPLALRRRMAAAWPAHGALRVSPGIASLAVVVAVVLVSTGERPSEEARRPAGWMPAVTPKAHDLYSYCMEKSSELDVDSMLWSEPLARPEKDDV
jgi:hypothetical protein